MLELSKFSGKLRSVTFSNPEGGPNPLCNLAQYEMVALRYLGAQLEYLDEALVNAPPQ